MTCAKTLYTLETGVDGYARGGMAQVKNTWHWKDGMGQWQSAVLVQNDYTYSNNGNRLTNTICDNTGPLRTETYGYDELSRLTSVNYGDPESLGAGGQTQGYTFDAMGNRLTKTERTNYQLPLTTYQLPMSNMSNTDSNHQ